MSLASWFHLPKLQFASDRLSSASRETLWGRPRVEQLEDRLLLAADAANQQGFLNNATVNFNTQAIGLTLPNGQTPLANTQIANGSVSPVLNGVALGAQANLPTQSQVFDQFRAFGVNSMGQSGQGSEFQQLQGTFLAMGMGFGSGVMPNAPWMPAAYNLGLGNHQFNYPSQADHGFPPAAPWFQQVTQQVHNGRSSDNEQATRIPEWMLIQQESAEDQKDEKTIPDANQSFKEESESELRRGDPAIENALFTDLPSSLQAEVEDNRLIQAQLGPDANENAISEVTSDNLTIPSPSE